MGGKEMKRLLTSTCTADHFLGYIPLYVYSSLIVWPGIDIKIRVLGDMSRKDILIIRKAMECAGRDNDDRWEINFINPPLKCKRETGVNCLRFASIPEEWVEYDYVMITDIDLFFFQTPTDLWAWSIHNMDSMGACYSAHHGPYKKPHRPEIAPRWTGEWQRLAGGFVMITPEWIKRTSDIRGSWMKRLEDGSWGHFRESDEVMLYRICATAGMPIPTSKYMPPECRGLHFGDFKPEMRHRWTDHRKMLTRLTERNCRNWKAAEAWMKANGMIETLSEIPHMAEIFKNVHEHTQGRS